MASYFLNLCMRISLFFSSSLTFWNEYVCTFSCRNFPSHTYILYFMHISSKARKSYLFLLYCRNVLLASFDPSIGRLCCQSQVDLLNLPHIPVGDKEACTSA